MPRLLALLILVGCVLALTPSARADDAEDKAVAFVEKFGGEVKRDDKRSGKPVINVSLAFTKVTDAGIKELTPLKNLTTLNLMYTQVTDAGMKELAPLKNLTTLNLSNTKVTDAGLKELAALKNLTELHLDSTRSDGRGAQGTGRTQKPHHARPGRPPR